MDDKSSGKMDKDGHPWWWGTQSCATPRSRRTKVERLNTNQAVTSMLEGPAQGEKRKVEYKWLELWPPSNKKLFAGGVSSCESAENPSAAGLARPMEESPIGA